MYRDDSIGECCVVVKGQLKHGIEFGDFFGLYRYPGTLIGDRVWMRICGD